MSSNTTPKRGWHAAPARVATVPVVARDRRGAHWVVVHKPPGLPTVPHGPEQSETLVGALLRQGLVPPDVGYDEAQPGVLHRLDTHTQGLVLAARSKFAFDELRDQMKRDRIIKTYEALCHARPPMGEVSTWIGGRGRRSTKVRVSTTKMPRTVHRMTRIIDAQPDGPFHRVTVSITSGFRHQIRAHLAHLGAPLVGDAPYGGITSEQHPYHQLAAVALDFVWDGQPVSIRYNPERALTPKNCPDH